MGPTPLTRNNPLDLGGAALAGLLPAHGLNGAVDRGDWVLDAIEDTFAHIGTDRSIGKLLNRH